MTDARCHWNESAKCRALVDHHEPECEGDCKGCQPCTETHCRMQGFKFGRDRMSPCAVHAPSTCPSCVGEVRATLAEIRRLCDALPDEAEVKGVESEAAMLAGPAADPEAWQHRAMTAMVGGSRIVPGQHLPDCDGWIELEESA